MRRRTPTRERAEADEGEGEQRREIPAPAGSGRPAGSLQVLASRERGPLAALVVRVRLAPVLDDAVALGERPAQAVVAEVQLLQRGQALQRQRHRAPDVVVGQVQVRQLRREHQLAEVEVEVVPRQVHLADGPAGDEQVGGVAGELVVGEVHGVDLVVGVVARDGPRQLVVGQDQRPELPLHQPRRDGARQLVVPEVKRPEVGQVGERRRDGARQLVAGEVHGVEAAQPRQGLRDGARHAGVGDGEELQLGQRGEARRDGAREPRQLEQGQRHELRQPAHRGRDLPVHVVRGVDEDVVHAPGVVAPEVVPRAAVGRRRRPRRQRRRVAQRLLHAQQRVQVARCAGPRRRRGRRRHEEEDGEEGGGGGGRHRARVRAGLSSVVWECGSEAHGGLL